MKTILFDLDIKEDKHNHSLIRVGDERDGGYLLPLGIIENSNFLISGGLNYNIRFELGILNINPSIELLLYDKSVSSFKSFIRIFYYLLHPKRSFYKALVDFGSFKWEIQHLKNDTGVILNGYCLKDWMSYMFDHTTIISKDDPHIEKFRDLDKLNIIQLREVDRVGCEQFADLVFHHADYYFVGR